MEKLKLKEKKDFLYYLDENSKKYKEKVISATKSILDSAKGILFAYIILYFLKTIVLTVLGTPLHDLYPQLVDSLGGLTIAGVLIAGMTLVTSSVMQIFGDIKNKNRIKKILKDNDIKSVTKDLKLAEVTTIEDTKTNKIENNKATTKRKVVKVAKLPEKDKLYYLKQITEYVKKRIGTKEINTLYKITKEEYNNELEKYNKELEKEFKAKKLILEK